MNSWFRRPASSVFVAYTPAERACVLLLLLAMALLAAPFVLGGGNGSRLLLYGAFLLYLITLAFPFAILRFSPGIFHPLAFYVVWVGMQGLLRGQLALPITGLDYHSALSHLTSTNFDHLIALSFLLDAVAILSLYTGYALFPDFRVRRLTVPRVKAPGLKSVFWVGVAGLGLLALAGIGGGLEQVLMQRGMASSQRIAAQVGGHWNYLAGIGVVAPLVWLACDRRAIRSPVFWGVTVLAMAIKFASTGSRSGTIVPLIMIGAVYVLQRRILPYRVVVVGGVLTLLLLGGLGQYRIASMQAETIHEINIESGPKEWVGLAMEEVQEKVSEGSGQLAVLGRVPAGVPHLWGKSYLSVPFIFVPSAIVGEKPDAAGRLSGIHLYGKPSVGKPIGSVGEAYWNFSYPGVVFVFLIYGCALKVLAGLYRNNQFHPAVITLLIFVLFYMRPSSDALYTFFHSIVPAVIMYASFLLKIDWRVLVDFHSRFRGAPRRPG